MPPDRLCIRFLKAHGVRVSRPPSNRVPARRSRRCRGVTPRLGRGGTDMSAGGWAMAAVLVGMLVLLGFLIFFVIFWLMIAWIF